MRLRGGSALRLASAKAWLHRFTFVLLFGATLALMVIGKSDSSLVERARLLATDALTPIMDGISRPLATVRQAYDNAREFLNLREENAALREQQARLAAMADGRPPAGGREPVPEGAAEVCARAGGDLRRRAGRGRQWRRLRAQRPGRRRCARRGAQGRCRRDGRGAGRTGGRGRRALGPGPAADRHQQPDSRGHRAESRPGDPGGRQLGQSPVALPLPRRPASRRRSRRDLGGGRGLSARACPWASSNRSTTAMRLSSSSSTGTIWSICGCWTIASRGVLQGASGEPAGEGLP